MRFLLCLVLTVFSSTLVAQKFGLPLMRAIHESKDSDKIFLYVQGDEIKIRESLIEIDGEFRHSFRGYISVSIPSNKVEGFVGQEFIKTVSFQYHRPILLSDSMRAKSNVIKVNDGQAPLPKPYKGKDVIIGIIDSGIDYTHPDFIDSLGNTKVLYIWDQTVASPTLTPDNFTYGQQWDSTDINSGTCTHMDPSAYFGHGTNVSGVAASNGNATSSHYGSAPDANLIVVASDYNSANWLGTVADGVEYIYSMADSLGLPCVINISAGTYTGSHDGLDIDAQRIDSLMKAKSGRALVCAAGNSGQVDPFHLGYNLSSDTNFTWFEFNPSFVIPGYAPSGAVYFELYSDTGDFSNAKFSYGADLVNPTYSYRGNMQYLNMAGFFDGSYAGYLDGNGIFVDSIVNTLGQKLADVYIGYALINNGETYFMQTIISPDSSVSDYAWRFLTTGQGKFDVWSTSAGIMGLCDITNTVPSAAIFSDSLYYKYPDTMQSIVSSFQCLPDVITVGNYTNLNQFVDVQGNLQLLYPTLPGDLYPSSSLGPTRKGEIKPTIVGPGSTMLTATRMSDLVSMLTNQPQNLAADSMHRTAAGTSMASPGVAGIVALLFESCPDYDYAKIKEAIIGGAQQDNYTGITPNNYYGYGKADALKSIMHAPNTVDLLFDNLIPSADSVTICSDGVLALDGQFVTQKWSTGETSPQILTSVNGEYYAAAIDAMGCIVASDSITVVVDPFVIPVPTLNIGDSISCEDSPIEISTIDSYFGYDWSTNASTASISTSSTGGYSVLVEDAEGCKAYSDTILLTFLISPPVPSIGVLNDTILSSSVASSYQWYFSNAMITGADDQDYIAQDSGFYFVEVFHPNGCSAISDSVYVTIPIVSSLKDFKEGSPIAIYPNPVQGELTIEVGDKVYIQSIEVYNSLGQLQSIEKASGFNNPTITKIEMGDFMSGMYFLYIRTAQDNWMYRIIKQ